MWAYEVELEDKRGSSNNSSEGEGSGQPLPGTHQDIGGSSSSSSSRGSSDQPGFIGTHAIEIMWQLHIGLSNTCMWLGNMDSCGLTEAGSSLSGGGDQRAGEREGSYPQPPLPLSVLSAADSLFALQRAHDHLMHILKGTTPVSGRGTTADSHSRDSGDGDDDEGAQAPLRGTFVLPSLLDIPLEPQAAVGVAARQALAHLRAMAAEAPMPDEVPRGGSESSRRSHCWASWEVLRAELMAGLPHEGWREPLWCCNPGCTNLSGASELQLKTYACGGKCGWRYCSKECQEDGWRQGHKHSCRVIAAQGRAVV
jgi:hypothetical protein